MNYKEKILKKLIENEKPITGIELGKTFNLSRKSIWKYIQQLKKEGYEIDAKNTIGYQLNKNVSFLSSSLIEYYLNKKIHIECFDTIDSTSTYAKKIAENIGNDFLICSSLQTNGRGRTGNTFYSPKNGTYFSLVIKPKNENDLILATIKVGIAIHRVLKKLYSIDTQIKWVNDIYFNNKKIVGILSESIADFETGKIESIIFGIGLNINLEAFPKELDDIATSLHIENYDKNFLIASIVNEIYTVLFNESNYIDEFNNNSFLKGKEISYIINGQMYQGIAQNINSDGELVVKLNNSFICLNAGEVKIVKKKYE